MTDEPAPPPQSLGPQQLYAACDSGAFAFTDTRDLPAPQATFGQDRAMQALQIGLETQGAGYNIIVLGQPGCGRHAAVRRLLETHARSRPPPPDCCYIYNFRQPESPRLLILPAGEGQRFRDAMEDFVDELTQATQAAFEGREYQARIEAIQKDYRQREGDAMHALGERAVKEGVGLIQTAQGFTFAPVKNGEPMAPQDYDALPAQERERISHALSLLKDELLSWTKELSRLRREMQARMREANADTLALAAGHLVEEIKQRFSAHAQVQSHMDDVLEDIIKRGDKFRTEIRDGDEDEDGEDGGEELTEVTGSLLMVRYQVNLLVGHLPDEHAPVEFCDNPTHAQLVGRIEHVSHRGTLMTNFTMIRAGALHRAQGGYLLMDAIRLLERPHAWDTLKRALRSNRVVIESLPDAMGLDGGLQSMVPQPSALDAKVILFGEREHYELLHALDPEFSQLFGVAADFEDDVPRTPELVAAFAGWIGSLERDRKLRPCEPSAVARLVEHSARLAGHAQRLSTHLIAFEELLQEANTHAARSGSDTLTRIHIEAALASRERRREWVRERLQLEVLEGRLQIATSGSSVGQVNGLAVADLCDLRFGRPLRITATARIGDDKVLDIERESALGQPLHSKGILILTSYLGARYAPSAPLSLSASLVFEQSYGPVEGDSASLAELCALLSALARVPLRQDLAVTGSVNQFGIVQAVGSVNEKIEGFFDLCRLRGLSGEQGVIIPASNTLHLMLRGEVVQAVAEGKFHVHAVSDVDGALQLLSGLTAGQADACGRWPAGSFNAQVATRLEQLGVARQSFGTGQAPRLRKARQAGAGVIRIGVPRGRAG